MIEISKYEEHICMSVTHKSPYKRIMDDTILKISLKTTWPKIYDNALRAFQTMRDLILLDESKTKLRWRTKNDMIN